MRNLIGFGLMILGGVLTSVSGIDYFIIIQIVGMFLFASIDDEAMFYDYVIANSNVLLIRKRYYFNFFPLTFAINILTLGIARVEAKIFRKDEYFKSILHSKENIETIKISRKDYIALRNEQRKIYSTQVLSKEFMDKYYDEASIGFKRKKTRLIIVCVLAALMLIASTEPDSIYGIYMALIYEAVFISMVILWIPDYKDAKILKEAYERAMAQG